MTRPSERELRRAVDSLDVDAGRDAGQQIVIETTIVGTDWQSPADSGVDSRNLDAGETATERRVIELGGADR